MYRINRAILVALFVAVGAFAGIVSAQEATPTFDADVLATQMALEADVDATVAAMTVVPVLTQSGTLVNDASPLPTPVVVEIPEGGADITDTGDVIVIVQKQDEGKNVVIVGLFALVLVLVAVVVWQADRLRVMIPAPLVPVLEKGADVGLDFGDKVVKATPGTIDDSLLQLIRDLKESFFEALRRTPPVEPPPAATSGSTINVPSGTTIVAQTTPVTTPLQPSPEAVQAFIEGADVRDNPDAA